MIAGKGHEQGQEFESGRKLQFDDVTVAREILRGVPVNAGARLRVRRWTPHQVADAAGARLIRPASGDRGPDRVVIDSREAGPGTLFVGLAGSTADGGSYAAQALAAGAWGVLTRPQYTDVSEGDPPGAILAADDPLAALQRLASAWRRHLAAKVIGVTGSTGKTTTKDLLLATLAPHRRTVASRANFNTEIGLPLEIWARRRTPRCWCWRWRCGAPARSPRSQPWPSRRWG